MKRSTAAVLLFIAICGITLLDHYQRGTSLLVLQALPLSCLAFLYGYAGALATLGYAVLVAVLAVIGILETAPAWQWVVVLCAPVLTAWVNAIRTTHASIMRMHLQLFENMRDGVLLVDASFGIRLISPAARRLLALPENADEQLAYLRTIGLYDQWVRCAQGHREADEFEFPINGRVLQIAVAQVREDGEFAGLVTTVADYTSERQLSATREEFLALISHELRNPLTAINGFAEVLISQTTSESISQYAAVIKRNADRMLRLIRDLLQLKTIESGTFQLRPRTIDLLELLGELVADLRPITEQAGVMLRVDGPGVPIYGDYDPDRLSQVFINLLDNALKYTPRGGQVQVIVSTVEDTVLIEVNDPGPGIPSQEIYSIFEKYYQSSTGRSAGQGAGLGLPICRQLVELHGGRIWATSEEHLGTSFWVMLPTMPSGTASSASSAALGDKPLPRGTIIR